jgi:hypothetical protein
VDNDLQRYDRGLLRVLSMGSAGKTEKEHDRPLSGLLVTRRAFEVQA